MRSLGEFVGHVVKASKTDPDRSKHRQRVEVHRETEEKREGNMILRRTTIEEVEYADNDQDDDQGRRPDQH